jgi:uncharacterized damage-inducible protein DinB
LDDVEGLMSLAQQAQTDLEKARERFNRSIKNLTESESTFQPAGGMMTAAQQVAHVAYTIEWFIPRAFSPDGFTTPFEALAEPVRTCASLMAAKAWFDRAIDAAKQVIGSKSDADLLAPLPDGRVMGGAPRLQVVRGMIEHAAHHRGALTVYARVAGLVPGSAYSKD